MTFIPMTKIFPMIIGLKWFFYFFMIWIDCAQLQIVFTSFWVGTPSGFFSLKLFGGILSFETILHISFALSACFSIENLSQFDKLRCARAMPFPGSVWHFKHDLSAIFITLGEIGLLTIPFFVEDWAVVLLRIMEVRKTTIKIEKEIMIAFFINSVLRLWMNFHDITKVYNLIIVCVIRF